MKYQSVMTMPRRDPNELKKAIAAFHTKKKQLLNDLDVIAKHEEMEM